VSLFATGAASAVDGQTYRHTNNDVQLIIDSFYHSIVDALLRASDVSIPKVKRDFYKFWSDEKSATKNKERTNHNEFTNSLNDALLEKDMDSFWRTWRSKFVMMLPWRRDAFRYKAYER